MSRDAWDRAYSDRTHEHQWDTPWSSPELAGYLAALPTMPRTALDLGCGTGGDAVFLAEQGIETTGLDFSAAALELARKRAERRGVAVTWVEGDVLDLPIADESIDLAIDRGCLHHVAPDDQATYAREVARILRPGGRLLIREMNEAGRHKHAVSEESIVAMLDPVPMSIRSLVPFDMVGPHGSARATICVIERD